MEPLEEVVLAQSPWGSTRTHIQHVRDILPHAQRNHWALARCRDSTALWQMRGRALVSLVGGALRCPHTASGAVRAWAALMLKRVCYRTEGLRRVPAALPGNERSA